jgi:mono/diheme cytochrome c family protein
MERSRLRRLLLLTGIGIAALVVAIQAVPYGRNHSNPPVAQEPRWDSKQTRALAQRVCFDCHSNLTKWRWYSNVAPVSWLVQGDVDGGRGTLNFSEWNRPQDASAGDIAESIRGGSMPPWFYVILHAEAKLNAADKDALVRGLDATLATSPPIAGGG